MKFEIDAPQTAQAEVIVAGGGLGGIAAAVAAKGNATFETLNLSDVQKELKRQRVF